MAEKSGKKSFGDLMKGSLDSIKKTAQNVKVPEIKVPEIKLPDVKKHCQLRFYIFHNTIVAHFLHFLKKL